MSDLLSHFNPSQLPLAIAFSAGADSTALLLACAQRWPGQVIALHVHHGLQAAADDFEHHCRAICNRFNIALHVAHVHARHAPGESPENAARQTRYRALADLLRQPALAHVRDIALAHHADDQVETIMLALSRGAGVAGIAAMPAQWQQDGFMWHRPFLGVPGAELRDWLRQRNVPWIEDPSNADTRYTRNRIRTQLLPALQKTFPEFRTTFARSAAHAAQAQELLQDVARQDLLLTGAPPRIAILQHLSKARQGNVLRYWLREFFQTTPSTAQLQELLRQIEACTSRGHCIHIKVGQGTVLRQKDTLTWQK